MPITDFQQELLTMLADPASDYGYLAGGAALHFTPLSLLELLKRRGRYRPQDLARLDLVEPFDLPAAKKVWLAALEEAEFFVRSRPPEELGCLYWATDAQAFVMPAVGDSASSTILPHFGRPGGVLPQVRD